MATSYNRPPIEHVNKDCSIEVSKAARRKVYEDIVKCESYNNILEKLETDAYKIGKCFSHTKAQKIYTEVTKMIKEDFDAKKKELKETFLSNLLDIANDARRNNDRYSAVMAIKEAVKLTGAAEPSKFEVDSMVTINFGFDKEDDDNNTPSETEEEE